MDSFWEELEGLYICNNCKHYSEEDKDICPNCKRKMLGVQKIIEPKP